MQSHSQRTMSKKIISFVSPANPNPNRDHIQEKIIIVEIQETMTFTPCFLLHDFKNEVRKRFE